MSLARAPLEPDDTADQTWFTPLAMFIAWLAHLFEQVAKLKRIRRTTKFKANWRDHWDGLRQLEWMRDHVLAACAARLLAGQDLEFDFIPSTEPPADYGGPCPKTPFEMNRRFLAIARFNADPEPAIREHAARIAKRAGIDINSCPLRLGLRQATSPALRAGEETSHAYLRLASLAARRGRWIAAPSQRDGRGSHNCRGPPLDSVQNHKLLPPQRTASEAAPACAPAFRSAPNPGNATVLSLTGRITCVVSTEITGVPCNRFPTPKAASWKPCGASRHSRPNR